jgi:hypothetical protein
MGGEQRRRIVADAAHGYLEWHPRAAQNGGERNDADYSGVCAGVLKLSIWRKAAVELHSFLKG